MVILSSRIKSSSYWPTSIIELLPHIIWMEREELSSIGCSKLSRTMYGLFEGSLYCTRRFTSPPTMMSNGSLVLHLGHSNFFQLIETNPTASLLTFTASPNSRFFSHSRCAKPLKPGHLHTLKIGFVIETSCFLQIEQSILFLEESFVLAYSFISAPLTKLIVLTGAAA